MEKNAACTADMCPYGWPKLPEVSGWHHDAENSIHFGMNAQTPDVATFANAETIIYAKSSYKQRTPEIKSLQQFIESEQQDSLELDPDLKIEEVRSLVTADGQKLKSYLFSPSEDGNWEQVSYGEEGEFYLVFTLSSKTKSGLQKARADYEKFITRYKSKP